MIRIPFNRPFATGDELDYIRAAIAAPKFSGDGSFTAQCHLLLEQSLGIQKALLTTSCTHALEMAALLLDTGPEDEVIVPSFAFPSAANAFVLRGAKPVFVDIRADTLNIDESQIEQRITARTKRFFLCITRASDAKWTRSWLSRAGMALLWSKITRMVLMEGIADDTSARLDSLATLSFHETKNFTCGEGGALLINDANFNERAEILREKGTNRSRFFRGEIDNTPGSMSVRAICLRTCWRPFSVRSLNTATRFSRCGVKSGKSTLASWLHGPKPTAFASRSCRQNANRVTTCFT